MAEKSAGAILSSTIEKIRDLVDTSTIIGEAIYAEGGTTIIPVSKVTYGFASGGADFPSKSNQDIFGGGGDLHQGRNQKLLNNTGDINTLYRSGTYMFN